MKVKWLSHVRLSTNTYIWNLGNGTDKPISRQNQRHRHREWTCIQNGEGEGGIEIDTPLLLFLFSHQVLHDSFVTPWTVAQQVPLSIGFPRQEYWSGLPFSSPRDLPDPGIELTFFALAGGFFITEPPGKSIQFSSVQSLSCVRLFATPWITARQASLSITNSRSSLRLTSIESVMHSSHLILCRPLLLLPPISQLFA